jgi:hypothetical protein
VPAGADPVSTSGGSVSNRLVLPLAFCVALFLPIVSASQQQPEPATTFCTFDDGKEVSLRYQAVEANKKNDPISGKPWSPGGAPMFLFTPTDLTIGNATIPTGAYSVYTIRNKNDWTLIVNKNVTQGSAYDQQQDLVRVPMEVTKLSATNKPLVISLGHTAPKTCSLQLVYGDTGAWTEFKEK